MSKRVKSSAASEPMKLDTIVDYASVSYVAGLKYS